MAKEKVIKAAELPVGSIQRPNLLPQPEKNNDSNAFQSGAKMQTKPVGSSGTELFAGYFSEEYLQSLRGRKGAKVYDEMRRSESQIAMLMNAVMNPIKAGVWEFEAAEIPDGEKQKELIEYIAKECIDFETFLHEALTFLIFGYSIFEVVNSVVFNHPKFGTFNGLKGLAFRSQKTIERWNVDAGTGELQTVEQWVQGDLVPGRSAFLKMPAEFLLIFSLQKEGDNYEGISSLRAMYGAWFRKNLYLKLAAIGVEKSAIGTVVGTIPANKQDPSQIAEFKSMLSNFTAHESAYLVKPAGWEVEVIKGEFDSGKIKELIILENTEMINSLVANFLALGTGGGSGSFALGTDLSDFFLSGIQIYADLIAGVWNRKLIPNLIKLNFGEQEAYPKLKVSGINDKAGKELSDIISAMVGSKVITADTKLEDFVRKSYDLPAQDPTTAREAAPAPAQGGFGAKQFSEARTLQLAETYKSQWNKNKAATKTLMQVELQAILQDLKKQIERQYKNSTPSQKVSIGLKIEAKTANYEKALREQLAAIANDGLIGARKQTPKAKAVKLSERILLIAPKGGYYEALPNNIKRIVASQAGLIAQTQGADLSKIVAFQYGSSQSSTESIEQILFDIEAAAAPTIDGAIGKGMSVDAAAGNAVSTIFNQAQLEWFFEPEVLNTIESFTFYNEDPISEICNELDETTWAVGDPDLDRYGPPLHHNCKSRLQPNEKGAEGNPEITGTPAISQDGLDSITLCECDYHLKANDMARQGE
jgi:hypothetical protein